MTTDNNKTPLWRDKQTDDNEAYNHVLQALAILMHKHQPDKTDQDWADAIYRVQRWTAELNQHPNIHHMAEAYPAKQYTDVIKETLQESCSDWEL